MKVLLALVVLTTVANAWKNPLADFQKMSPNEWKVLSDLVVGEYKMKYAHLGTPQSERDSETSMYYDIGEAKSDQSMLDKLGNLANFVIKPAAYQEKRKSRFRTLTSEKSPSELSKLQTAQKEKSDLDKIDSAVREARMKGEPHHDLVADLAMSKKLFNRHVERQQANEDNHFQPLISQTYDFEGRMEPIELHHRKLQESTSNNNQTNSTSVASEEPVANTSSAEVASEEAISQPEVNSTSTVAAAAVAPATTNSTNATNSSNTTNASNSTEPEAKETDPNMDPTRVPDVAIRYISEIYPDQKVNGQTTSRTCQGQAKYVNQTQTYYQCWVNENPGMKYRVTNDSFYALTTYPYYKARVTCSQSPIVKQVCFCPAGFSGSLCQFSDYRKCYVNVTEPALAKGCTGSDSDDYVYSIQGFAPCHFVDFDTASNFQVNFKLDCRDIDDNAVVKPNGHTDGVKYKYQNIVEREEPTGSEFTYAATNPKTGLKVTDGASALVSFDFRDFKYISEVTKFQSVVTNPDVIVGVEEGSLSVDFTQMTKKDQASQSQYEVAGRMYFEVSAFGAGVTSFSTNGFFDREGYKEPVKSSVKRSKILKIVLPIAGVLLLVGLCLLWSHCSKQKAQKEEEEKLRKFRSRQAEKQRFLQIEKEQQRQRKEQSTS